MADHRMRSAGIGVFPVGEWSDGLLARRHMLFVRAVEEEQMRTIALAAEIRERARAVERRGLAHAPQRDAVGKLLRPEGPFVEDDDVRRQWLHLSVDRAR